MLRDAYRSLTRKRCSGGITLLFQSTRLVAAVAELGSLATSRLASKHDVAQASSLCAWSWILSSSQRPSPRKSPFWMQTATSVSEPCVAVARSSTVCFPKFPTLNLRSMTVFHHTMRPGSSSEPPPRGAGGGSLAIPERSLLNTCMAGGGR